MSASTDEVITEKGIAHFEASSVTASEMAKLIGVLCLLCALCALSVEGDSLPDADDPSPMVVTYDDSDDQESFDEDKRAMPGVMRFGKRGDMPGVLRFGKRAMPGVMRFGKKAMPGVMRFGKKSMPGVMRFGKRMIDYDQEVEKKAGPAPIRFG